MGSSPLPIIHSDQVSQDNLQQIAGHVTEATGSIHTSFDIQPPQDAHPLNQQTQDQIGSLSDDDTSISDSLPFLGSTVGSSRAISFLKEKMSWLGKKYGGEVRLK